ncbi:uncharacterized protein LOC141830473 [Curcuma longa]|uniref:uncharacterized protein LOC141830473 n=1 Tax=Curcuma longa TaxID=136217 RepID=UPI003D9E99D7
MGLKKGQCRRRREQVSAPAEDLLTSLQDDLLISILSFLPVKQRVALSAVCSCFRRLLPSIPRLDAFRLDVGHPSGGVDISQQFTFPRALIRQCHIAFHDGATELPNPLGQLLVGGLVEVGVEDLILETSGCKRWFNLREICCFFGIMSLRSLSLRRIAVGGFCNRLLPATVACTTFLTSLKMDHCVLGLYGRFNFLHSFLASSCPFLETLQFICCAELYASDLTIRSTSIKHLVLLHNGPNIRTIDVRCPKLESLTVDVAADLRIEAPKVQHASLLLCLDPPVDPPDALTKLFGTAFRSFPGAWLMLNSSKTPNGLAAENEIDRIVSPEDKEDLVIFNLDFNLEDQSSTMIFTQFLKKCHHSDNKFDIHVGAAHIQSTKETARDDDQLLHHGSTDAVELIKLRMIMPEKIFRGFLSNQKEMKEELKQMGLRKLKSHSSRDQFDDIVASNESLVEVSSSVANCIEMKF